MPLLSLTFVALLATGILLGGMMACGLALPRLADRHLPPAVAGPFVRRTAPAWHAAGATLALVAALCMLRSVPGLLLALVGTAFLLRLVWLDPAIGRHGHRGLEGDGTALTTAHHLHRVGTAISVLQFAASLVAFALIARG